MKFSKQCPDCGLDQSYKTKGSFTRALSLNTKCLSCAAKIGYRNNRDHDGTETTDRVGIRTDHYVYCYYDPNSGQPFYVGKGVDNRDVEHLLETKETTINIRKFNKIQKLIRDGTPPIIKRLVEGISAAEAMDIEKKEIEFLGRKEYDCGGILTNVCVDNNPPNMTGRKFSESHKANHKKALQLWHQTNIHPNLGKKRPKQALISKDRYLKGIGLGSLDFKGPSNPRALTYKFTNSNGEEFLVKGEFKKFCQDQGLSSVTMGKAKRTGKFPTYGKCAGWKVEKLNYE